MSEQKLRVRLLPTNIEDEVRKVYCGYRQCYSKGSLIDAIDNNTLPSFEKQCEFITKIVESNHISPTEHMHFTMIVEGMARSTTLQFIRHRIGIIPEFDPSVSQQSQRYCGLEVDRETNSVDINYVLPRKIANCPEAKDLVEEHIFETNKRYVKILDALVSKYGDVKSVYEDVRCILPECTETRLVITVNYTAWMHLFGLRGCTRAQDAIRGFAYDAELQLHAQCPQLFPKKALCHMHGLCTESPEFSCGAEPTLQDYKKAYAEQHT